MGTLSEHHRKLTNGVGKCSVPTWQMGCPSGFCDAPAYGPQTRSYLDSFRGMDPRYHRPAFAPGLACQVHGGPAPTHFGDPCVHCGTPHNEVPVGPCKSAA